RCLALELELELELELDFRAWNGKLRIVLESTKIFRIIRLQDGCVPIVFTASRTSSSSIKWSKKKHYNSISYLCYNMAMELLCDHEKLDVYQIDRLSSA